MATVGDSLQLDETPMSECQPPVYLSVKLRIQFKPSLHVLGIQFRGTDQEGTFFKT